MPSHHAHSRCLAPLLAGLVVGLGAVSGAAAQDPSDEVEGEVPESEAPEVSPPEPPRRRVAVLIMATGGVDPALAEGLGEVLVGALATRGGLTLVGREEFQAQLGQGDAGTLECISDMACLGRVGVQLDLVEVIAGTLARRDERWVFNLNRVDVHAGQIVGRVFREVEGDLGAVADGLQTAIPELYVPPRPAPPEVPPAPAEPAPGVLVLSAPVDGAEVSVDGALIGTTRAGVLRHELPPGSVAVQVAAPGYHAWQRTVRVLAGREVEIEASLVEAYEETIHPLVWIGGAVAVASFATALGLGVTSQQTFDFTDSQRMSGDVLRAELVAFYDARQREAITADVLFGVAGLAAAGALVALFFPERRRVTGVAVLPTPGGVGLLGSF